MKKKITGLVIFLFVILIAIGPNLVKFLDLPTIVVILGCGSGLTLLESNEKKSRGDNVLALKKNFVFSGWFISLVGIIMVFVFVKRKVYQFSIEKYTIILKKLMAF